MKLNEYQRKAFQTARIDWDDARKRHIPAFGVLGELGSLVSELKKTLRDGKAYTEGGENLIEEFGDLIWYISAIASRHQLQLETLVNDEECTRPEGEFDHIYAMASAFSALVSIAPDLGLDVKGAKQRRITRTLAQSLNATLTAIQREEMDLDVVLSRNLRKVNGIFGSDASRAARCFDKEYPPYERLPRNATVQFLERDRGPGRLEVILRVNDMNIGDRLTDNAKTDDGYRYHDAFHLAYAAVLGWSPIVRKTFRCKRKSNARVDEVQDGARAAIIEEAIAQTIFNYARGHSMLEGLDRIDHGILKLIQRMVSGLEVRRCAPHEWQHAIFVGFDAFRELKRHRGGWLVLNAEDRSLYYSRTEPGAG